MAKLVSKVYGDALFSLATEENQVDELWEEAAMVHEAVDTNPEFLSVLCHPEMTMEKTFPAAGCISKGTVTAYDGAVECPAEKGAHW